MLHTLRAAPSQGTIVLPPGFRQDLDWFATFLPSYNGVQFIIPHRPSVHLQVLTTPTHLQAVWEDREVKDVLPPVFNRASILAHKEIYTIYVALLLWGDEWSGVAVNLHTASPAKVEVLVHGKTRDMTVLHIARCIWLITAQLDIKLEPTHHYWGPQGSTVREKWAIPQAAVDILSSLDH
jgi:hypothetical protein